MATTSLDLQTGPQLMALCFNWALLGALNIQVYTYYDYFPADRWSLKCLVYGMLVYEWVQTGLITAVGTDIYVYGYGNIHTVVGVHNGWFSVAIMDGLVAAVVQIFFARRIYKLSKMGLINIRLLAGTIVVLAVAQAIASVIGGVMQKLLDVATSIQHDSIQYPLAIWLALSVLADVMIAVSMTILLFKSKTGIARTDALINRVIRLVVETGTLTASMAIVTIILANHPALRETLLYETPSINLTKIYANTFLMNLNNRVDLRRRVTESIPMSDLRFAFSQHVTSGHISDKDVIGLNAFHKSLVLGGAASLGEIESQIRGAAAARHDATSQRRRYSVS